MSDYKQTLHLPTTSFPMKANLKQREPEMLKRWEEIDAYEAMVAASGESGEYVLHDGPPYANGHIHLGTALNKVLKDIIVKSRNMMGFSSRYVPGWDCHGLPIEHKVALELKEKGKVIPPLAVRKRCRDYASKFLDIQRKEFKRLGVMGHWDEPYQTMHPEYEAATAGELARFMGQGSVARNKKPIHWCLSCQTALAEAEVEYAPHASPSIYVAFPMEDGEKFGQVFPDANAADTCAVIWTTTPWTIPDNMAVAVHPDLEYALVSADGNFYIVAKELVESLAETFGWADWSIKATTTGDKLEGLVARHPFYDRPSPLVLGQHVTLEAGTGLVHTAPGHGREDYETGLEYGLEILSPMDDSGRFLESVEHFAGLNVWEANPKVIEILKSRGRLLSLSRVEHSYPHCWRCKEPVIFRATTQWFITMEANDLRKKALNAIDNEVRWIPSWGRERIHNMIANRPDWCISRQRTWGVPIVALLCEACDEAYFDQIWVEAVVAKFATHERGCDYWFEAELDELLAMPNAPTACPTCGASKWKKETDILDVWFDSGTSFAAVLEKRKECRFPADLYLEGSDQHRGWFHSSLLASVGNRGQAPYKAVLTHGYVVDGEGKKMSKSVGNVVAPQEIIDKYGAEILRMWVASVDYTEDVRISEEIMSRLVDAYRRIRNTTRYLLGNLYDFTPADAVADKDLLPLDRYALDLAARNRRRNRAAFENYEFHRVFHNIHNACVTDLSAFYLDCVKDRLYASRADSIERRSAQTVIWKTLLWLLADMAPILSFTAEEAFGHLPDALKPDARTVFAMKAPELPAALDGPKLDAFEALAGVRAEVTKAIEPHRKSGDIGHSLSAVVTLYADDELRESLAFTGADLAEAFIVSGAELAPLDDAPEGIYEAEDIKGLKVAVAQASGDKCERCWKKAGDVTAREAVGEDVPAGAMCTRCAAAVGAD
ncbi:isoleucine--tRNA ligase [Oceanidesulfovibrio indonesiensis]|uniref:Isoleucine--tRNA ligase n=1 Tax=Oceanidesulfovibrio indonesiensis TaxID=54767 RepID=A0A7M3MHI4_9BACT|nr:isoleucine--tRNA ligase [Oceanidesulfovibrio indonesiensis]TVM18391.1 isoleucine--tRNA ligase [Oceanidesulfovibrio indonesiensis]